MRENEIFHLVLAHACTIAVVPDLQIYGSYAIQAWSFWSLLLFCTLPVGSRCLIIGIPHQWICRFVL